MSSPLGSGNVGADFESEVGAVYLVALLVRGSARGAVGGRVVEVRVQQGALGAPLDDVIVETESPSGRLRLDLQVKRTFTFAPGDRELSPVLDRCWDTFRAFGLRDAGHRFGVALLHSPANVKQHYARVPVWAVTSPSAAHFFDRIGKPGLSSQAMRDFVRTLSDHLRRYAPEEATDETLWQFFRCLAIVDFDLEQAGSRDRLFAVELLRTILPNGDLAEAQDLFRELTDLVRDAKKTGGGYTEETLRARLLGRGLGAARSLQPDLERLVRHSDQVLRSIRDTLGGLVLDRSDLFEDVFRLLECGKTVLLLGPPGTGKSALARALGQLHRADGPVLALSHQRLQDMVGWAGFASTLQLQGHLEEIVLSLSGTTRPCLILDGADQIEKDGPRLAVNDLLRAINDLPKGSDGGSRWSVLITLRSEMLPFVLEWIALPNGEFETFQVPELSQDDLAALANDRPHLREILSAPQIGPVVRNPYFLRIFEEARGRAKDAPDRPATEVEVQDLWWNQIVGRNQDRGRQQMILHFGEQWLSRRTRRFPNRDLAPDILQSFERDDILRHQADTESFVFSHDILEEWSAARALGQKEPDILGYLLRIGNPFWASRPLQLLACRRLEAEGGVARWRDLLSAAEAAPDASTRWVDAVLTAPFRSARLQELMPEIGEALLEGDGTRLRQFLRALRTQAIKPNRHLVQFLGSDSKITPRGENLLLEIGEPDRVLWMPVLSWLVPRLIELPESVREEASHLMAIWQRASHPGEPFRRRIAEAALAWRSVLLPIDGSRRYASSEAKPYFDRLFQIVANSADAIPDRIPELFDHLRATESEDDLKRWLAGPPATGLVQQAPALYAELTLDLLVPEWRKTPRARRQAPQWRWSPYHPGEEGDPEWEDLEHEYSFDPPSHLRGPFLFILNEDEAAGLHLINTLVNRATASWERDGTLRFPSSFEPERIVLKLPAGRRVFRGDRIVYRWFRTMSEAPAPVCCALMALEVWMEKQIESGRDPEELFSTVLASSKSIATVAVCVAMFLAYPERSLRAAVPFVTHPLIWDYDFTRYSGDQTGSFSFNRILGQTDWAEEQALKRNDRPQRRWELRNFFSAYVFSADEELRARVVPKIRRSRNKMFAAFGDPANYGDGVFRFPEEILKPRRPVLEHIISQSQYLELLNWVHAVADQRPGQERFSVPEVIQRARELQRPGDFTSPLSRNGEDFHERERLEAIVGAVATSLRLDLPRIIEEKQLSWCEHVLIAAAETPCSEEGAWRYVSPDDFVLSAARGLLDLLQQGYASERARQAAFGLLKRPEEEVIDLVFSRIEALWDKEPVLCRNAVASELALAVEPWREEEEPEDEFDTRTPRADAKVEEIRERCARNIREHRLPETIGLGDLTSDDQLKTGHVERALRSLPLERLDREQDLPWVLEITGHALAYTLRGEEDHPASRWLSFLGNWLARLGREIPFADVERLFLDPIRGRWPEMTWLMAALLIGWTEHRLTPGSEISEDDRRGWRGLAETILSSPEQPRSSAREIVLELLLHVRHGRPYLTENWPGADQFLDIYDHWVETIASTPWGFSRLLVFLQAAGRPLPADRAIRWLALAIQTSADRDKLWREHDNLARTAEVLADLWKRAGGQLQREPGALAAYMALLDELARAGSPLAARMRVKTGKSTQTER